MFRLLPWALLCLPYSGVAAQPGIGQNGVVNRASQIPTTLPGGSIARGAAFTIRGVRFGSAAAVSMRAGNATLPARVLAVQPEQIEALMPVAAPLGPASLVVTAGGSSSKPFSIEVTASNPGIFSQNKSGWGPGQIENIDPAGKRTLNSTANPAVPGQAVAMRITGLGKATPAIVVVGSRTVNAGLPRIAGEPGEQEVSFTIPADSPAGCYVPVYLEASPKRASNVVTITIQSKTNRPSHCDPGPVPMLDAKRIGLIEITRSNSYKKGGNTGAGEVVATFTVREPGLSLSPLLLLPPAGTCTAYTSSLQATASAPITASNALSWVFGSDGLAAGSQLTLERDKRRWFIPWDRDAVGLYRLRVPPRTLHPGKFVLSGPGGIDVGPFRISVDAPAPFEWTDREKMEVVARSQALALHWRGQASGRWTIVLATNVDQVTTAIGTCLCSAPLNATHFEIPAALLANIPPSYDTPGPPNNQVFVVSLPKATPISMPGIGAGALVTMYANARIVQYH